MDQAANRKRYKQLARAKAKAKAELIAPSSDELSMEQRSIGLMTYKWAGRFTGTSLTRWLVGIQNASDRDDECRKRSAVALSVREYIARKAPQPVDDITIVKVVARLLKFAEGEMEFDKSLGLTRNENQLVHTCWFAVLAHSDDRSVSLKQFEKT